jgi:prepilin-type N-terminal cleavage/methylation domain-containing protein
MKNLLKTKRAEGFTIIEVMIVLAIAGLIMVIVFIAVPQLQRSQRDNARQNITNRVKAEVESYAGNNQGLYPFGSAGNNANGTACGNTVTGCWQNFITNYIQGGKVNVKDPSTGGDIVATTGATTGVPQDCGAAAGATCLAAVTRPANKGEFVVVYAAKCSGEDVVQSGSSSLSVRTFAVLVGLDRAGTRYCVDNG